MWRHNLHLLFVHLHFTPNIQLAQYMFTPLSHLTISFSDAAATPTPKPRITTSMSDSSAGQSCIVCNKQDAKYCARYKSTCYCSQACQKSDWKTDKLLCAAFSTFDTSERPTKEHYRAVLFDPDKDKPEFVWLRCPWVFGGYQSPETEKFIGEDATERDMPIQHNYRLQRSLRNTINISYRDAFLADGSRPSKSIASITATQPGK